MPSARGETLEQAAFGGGLVHMKRLGIVLRCECFYLRSIKRVCPALEALADMKIVEIVERLRIRHRDDRLKSVGYVPYRSEPENMTAAGSLEGPADNNPARPAVPVVEDRIVE